MKIENLKRAEELINKINIIKKEIVHLENIASSDDNYEARLTTGMYGAKVLIKEVKDLIPSIVQNRLKEIDAITTEIEML